LRVAAIFVFVVSLGGCARPEAPVPPHPKAPPAEAEAKSAPSASRAYSFVVVVLSRGRGVPPAAREAMKRVAAMVEADRARGLRVESRSQRIGLEGETCLAIEYESATEGARAKARADEMAVGVDLFRVEAGPCPAPAGGR
jgi:hypothetical protein